MSTITKIIRFGNSQALRIPAQLAFDGADEVEIERVGEELHIRPVHRSLAGAAALFAAFPPDFMSGVEREARDRGQEQGMNKKAEKRNLFAELTEGFDALAGERAGKQPLRPHAVTKKLVVSLSADELVALRETLHVSRAVFADYLRTNVRTLENWEQGRAKPNAQAAVLIRMVQRFPDTMNRLAVI